MKNILLIIPFCLISCTTFSSFSKFNQVKSCVGRQYLCVVNDSLALSFKSFGGFHFASNEKDFRKMKIKEKPKFKNVIIYGRSKILGGDYYLILNNEKYPQKFYYKDTIINNRKITIALSKKISYSSNKNFLLNFDENK